MGNLSLGLTGKKLLAQGFVCSARSHLDGHGTLGAVTVIRLVLFLA